MVCNMQRAAKLCTDGHEQHSCCPLLTFQKRSSSRKMMWATAKPPMSSADQKHTFQSTWGSREGRAKCKEVGHRHTPHV